LGERRVSEDRPMQHYEDKDIETEEVADFIMREAARLKRVCDHYGFGSISASLEMALIEAKRLLLREPDSEMTEQ